MLNDMKLISNFMDNLTFAHFKTNKFVCVIQEKKIKEMAGLKI